MTSTPDDQAFLAAILEDPRNDAKLLTYADWLESQGDGRAEFLREQVRYRRSPNEETRQRLITLYPSEHLPWTALLEQAGAIEANLTPYDFAWWGTGIGELRDTDATYERFEYQEQPPLPVETLNGEFQWLRSSEPQNSFASGAAWKAFCDQVRAEGYFVPPEFEAFMSDSDLPARVKSCTDNEFVDPPGTNDEYVTPTVVSDDGMLVMFYADSQFCVVWGILLPREPGRYAPILAGPPESLFPEDWGGDEYEDEVDKPVLAASQFEQFVYRLWIENEIWFATEWDDGLRPLNTTEQAYLDHLNSRYRDPE